MNLQQHTFLKLGEECNEVAMLCSKIMQFGLDSEYQGVTNRQRLQNELNDIMASIEYIRQYSDFNFESSEYEIHKKIDKMNHFRDISEELGLVTN